MTMWRRSEPRIVRPFFNLSDDLEHALDSAVLLLGDRDQEIEGSTAHLDQADFDGLHVAIRHDLPLSNVLEKLGERAYGVALVLCLRDRTFMRRVVCGKWKITEVIPQRLTVDADFVLEYGHKREIHITLALALEEELAPLPGLPHRPGEWIAKRVFKLRRHSNNPAFDIEKMTKEEAEKLTGFSGAFMHVDYYDGRILGETDDAGPIAICYIAEEIYTRLQQAGPQLQTMVQAEIITSILGHAANDIAEALDIPPGSPLAKIVKQLGGKKPILLESLKEIVRDPNKLRAAVHDRVGIVKQFRNL